MHCRIRLWGGRAEDDRRFFFLPTTAPGNRGDQPIDLSFLSRLGKSCTRQIRPSFPTCTTVHSRGNPLHVKSGRPFRHAPPCSALLVCLAWCWNVLERCRAWRLGGGLATCDDKRAHMGCQSGRVTPHLGSFYPIYRHISRFRTI